MNLVACVLGLGVSVKVFPYCSNCLETPTGPIDSHLVDTCIILLSHTHIYILYLLDRTESMECCLPVCAGARLHTAHTSPRTPTSRCCQ